jgi:2-keto-4-pentenoate hydratase/2-oxohepta-3-ene-1,7-dioic acid hydratase in catechol pathway
MKLVSFLHDGRTSYGVASDGGIVDAGRRLGARFPDLKAILAGDVLGDLRDLAGSASPDVAFDSATFLPVIPDPGKIFCIGINYETHRIETGRPEMKFPTVFTRFADTLVGHGQPIIKPRASDQVDFEGELAVIIGRGGRAIPEDAALAHVAGYACFNEVSIRDWQRRTSQFTPGKNFPGTGPFGPWMVTTDEIPDPGALTLTTRVNGTEMQHARTDDLTFGVAALIAYISTFTALAPGDVISTGTPGGVGFARDPQVFLKPGDTVEVEISGIGVLRNPVVAE